MIPLFATTILFFVIAVLASAGWYAENTKSAVLAVAHKREIDGINKVGKWYENRVLELEEETRSLASQVIMAGGAAPLHAMPIPPRDEYEEYATDATGLVVERLDPRDVS